MGKSKNLATVEDMTLLVAETFTNLLNENIKAVKNENQKWKTHYDDCIHEIEQNIKNTKEAIEEDVEFGFSISKIEREGSLRAYISILHEFKKNEKYVD
jgi:phage-related minor tail protein